MRLNTLLLVTLILSGLSGCNRTGNHPESSVAERAETEQRGLAKEQLKTFNDSVTSQNVSLNQADSANAASQAIERKIIRNANLTIEAQSPTESQRKIFSIAESHGGFVVTSEMSQQTTEDKSKPALSVNLVVRVPALQFDQVMEEIRSVASRVVQEKRTGQD